MRDTRPCSIRQSDRGGVIWAHFICPLTMWPAFSADIKPSHVNSTIDHMFGDRLGVSHQTRLVMNWDDLHDCCRCPRSRTQQLPCHPARSKPFWESMSLCGGKTAVLIAMRSPSITQYVPLLTGTTSLICAIVALQSIRSSHRNHAAVQNPHGEYSLHPPWCKGCPGIRSRILRTPQRWRNQIPELRDFSGRTSSY